MSLASSLGRPIDTPNRLDYFIALKEEFGTDAAKYRRILNIIRGWLEKTGYAGFSCIADEVQEISRLLKERPRLIRDVNAVLPVGFLVGCFTDEEKAEYVVLIAPTTGQILATSSELDVPEPSSTREIRMVLPVEEDWKEVVETCRSNPQRASCLSQLLQREVDDPRLDHAYKRMVLRRLIYLAKATLTLPPSLSLPNVSRDGAYPEVNGGYADIYKGKIKGQTVCIKSLRLFSAHGGAETKLKDFLREVLVWKRLSHPNVLPFLGANKTLFPFPSLDLISPWMKHGNLRIFLEKNPGHDRLTATAEIVSGLIYLHEYRPPIYHRDIKAVNVLVNDELHCCIGDFGLSSIAGSQRIESKSLAPGTVRWQAPELLIESEEVSKDDSAAADVYALGCTISEIYTGKIPFHKLDRDPTVIAAVMQGRKPELPSSDVGASDELQSLILSCWETRPQVRPTMRRIGDLLRDMGASVQDIPCTQDHALPVTPDLGPLDDAIAWIDKELAQWKKTSENDHEHTSESVSDEPEKGHLSSKVGEPWGAGIRKKIDLPPLITPSANNIGGLLTPISPDAFPHILTSRNESVKPQGASYIPHTPRKPFSRRSSPLSPFAAEFLPSPPDTPTGNAGQSVFHPVAMSLGASVIKLNAGAAAFLPSPKIRVKTHKLSLDAPAFFPPFLKGALVANEIPTMETPPAMPPPPLRKSLNPAAVAFVPPAAGVRTSIDGGRSSKTPPEVLNMTTPPSREADDVQELCLTMPGIALEGERPIVAAGVISPPATPLRLNPNAPVFSLGRPTPFIST